MCPMPELSMRICKSNISVAKHEKENKRSIERLARPPAPVVSDAELACQRRLPEASDSCARTVLLIVGRDLCIGNEALSAAGHELLELVLLYPSSAHSMLCVPGYPWQTLGCGWPAGQKVDNRGGILRCPWPCPAAVRARQKQLVASLGLQSKASKRLV